MTAYNARMSGRTPKASNKKDGGRYQFVQSTGFWGVAGFMPAQNPGEWTYTWDDGEFPAIKLVCGIEDNRGWVAFCDDGSRIEIGQCNLPEIKGKLDDIILSIVRRQADVDAPINLDDMEIGPEIDIDDWMTRPQAARRQNTPAVRGLAKKHKISLSDADEIMGGR